MKRACVFLGVLCVAWIVPAAIGQEILPLDKIQSQAELDSTMKALDAALFDSYNKCDLQKFKSFFVDNVEFYHDQGGLTLGKEASHRQREEEHLRPDHARTGEHASLLHERIRRT